MALHVDCTKVKDYEKMDRSVHDPLVFGFVLMALDMNELTERSLDEARFRADVLYGMRRGGVVWSVGGKALRIPEDIWRRMIGVRINTRGRTTAAWLKSVRNPRSWFTDRRDEDMPPEEQRGVWNEVRAAWGMPLEEA